MSRSSQRTVPLPPEAEALPDPELRLADLGGAIDFASLARDVLPAWSGRVEIEVGVGKGRFLLAEAAARPDVLFLGLEYSQPYLRLVRHRALASLLANVRLLRADAGDVVRRLLAPASVAAVHVLFPDPWPKRRHHERRLLNAAFAADVAKALVPGGVLNVATDHAEYGTWIAHELARVAQLEPLPRFALGDDLAARTHFAAKLARRGAEFFARSWARRA